MHLVLRLLNWALHSRLQPGQDLLYIVEKVTIKIGPLLGFRTTVTLQVDPGLSFTIHRFHTWKIIKRHTICKLGLLIKILSTLARMDFFAQTEQCFTYILSTLLSRTQPCIGPTATCHNWSVLFNLSELAAVSFQNKHFSAQLGRQAVFVWHSHTISHADLRA